MSPPLNLIIKTYELDRNLSRTSSMTIVIHREAPGSRESNQGLGIRESSAVEAALFIQANDCLLQYNVSLPKKSLGIGRAETNP